MKIESLRRSDYLDLPPFDESKNDPGKYRIHDQERFVHAGGDLVQVITITPRTKEKPLNRHVESVRLVQGTP